MKKAIRAKVHGITLVMLLLLAVSVAPVLASETGTTCGSAGNNATVSKPVIKELDSKERGPYIDKATLNANVKKIDSDLLKQGYIEQNKKAFKAQITDKNGSVNDIVAVAIVYEKNETDQKSILFIENEKTGITTTILVNGDATTMGILTCIMEASICVVGCVVCTGVCLAESIESDDGYACLACMLPTCSFVGACGLAICSCADSCCNAGNQWCCDHRCP